MTDKKNIQTAIFAGGCFWCMQPPYDEIDGVISTTVGYIGGETNDPDYESVCSGTTGHAEAVLIEFDADQISFRQLLDVFWKNIDPTNPFGQFADRGSQYRTAVFYRNEEQRQQAETSRRELDESGKFDKPVVTTLEMAGEFYPAENYHQKYYRSNPMHYNSYKIGSGRAGFIKKVWG